MHIYSIIDATQTFYLYRTFQVCPEMFSLIKVLVIICDVDAILNSIDIV